jgi:hypothetical protein
VTNGILTDISPSLQPGVGVLGLFPLIDLAQVVCVLAGGILSALHLFRKNGLIPEIRTNYIE